jgi:hypothetical protein
LLLCAVIVGGFAIQCPGQTAKPENAAGGCPPVHASAARIAAEPKRDKQLSDLECKLQQAQDQIQRQQGQIDQLQKSLQDSITALQLDQQAIEVSVQQAKEQANAAEVTASGAGAAVAKVENSVNAFSETLKTENTEVEKVKDDVASVDTALHAQGEKLQGLEEPDVIHYKGLEITPGGFLEGTSIVRNRNENADLASSFSAIPLNGTSNSKLSEYRGTARDSRLSMMIQTNVGGTKLTGYVEGDFLGAAPTSNYVQSGGFTPRLRLGFAQVAWESGWTISGGQFWSLSTTSRQGIGTLPSSEFIPNVMDGAYVVGFNWLRDLSVRVTKNFNNRIWAAVEATQPETTYSAAYQPSNIMGLNTSTNANTGVLVLPYMAGYSNGNSTPFLPDLLFKVAVEPGWGHFEIKGLGRFFRDRIASTADSSGYMNHSEGWGVGFGAILPVVKHKLDIVAEGMAGQGIGRYGASGLPDTTINPVTGELRPLREGRILTGLEYHLNKHFDIFTYFGDEYVARYSFAGPGGVAAGYGSPLVSYAACTNEVAMNTCSGANRNIYEGTVGYWFKIFQGRFGRLQYGNQFEYAHRDLWSGQGQTPRGGDFMVYSTVRFYLP